MFTLIPSETFTEKVRLESGWNLHEIYANQKGCQASDQLSPKRSTAVLEQIFRKI